MNHRGRRWLLIAAPIGIIACGNATDGEPTPLAQAGAAALTAGQGGGAAFAGASGGPSGRGGSSGSSSSGASGLTAASGSAGSSGEHTGGASGAAASGAGGVAASGSGGAASSIAVLVPIVQAFCAAARACCASENLPADLDDCEASFPAHDETFAAVSKGTATIDQAGLAACLSAYQAAATKCQEVPVLSACQGLVHGTQQENEPCVNVDECAHAEGEVAACLIADTTSNVGVCAKVLRGKLGETCLLSCEIDGDCAYTSYGAGSSVTYCFEQDGLYCSRDTGHCNQITPLGAPCISDDCGSANYCDTTCKKHDVLGQDCTQTCLDSLQCIDNQCQSPSFTVGGTCSGQWFGPW